MERTVGIIRVPSAPLCKTGETRVTIVFWSIARRERHRIHAGSVSSARTRTLTESRKIQRKKIPADA
jgi:hypothetical protein